MPGIEPGASYMQSMRSTTELHPRVLKTRQKQYVGKVYTIWHSIIRVEGS